MNRENFNVLYVHQDQMSLRSPSEAVVLHIQHVIESLALRGHALEFISLDRARAVVSHDAVAAADGGESQIANAARWVGKSGAGLFERATRRTQTQLGIPYFGAFDSSKIKGLCVSRPSVPDIIHERYKLMAVGGALASRKLKIPFILEVNADLEDELDHLGTPLGRMEREIARRATRFVFRQADTIVSVSGQLSRHLTAKWGVKSERIVTLPNAVALGAFKDHSGVRAGARLREEFKLGPGPICVFVGGFYQWHDLDTLLDAFARVVGASGLRASILMVGDGPMFESIEQRARSLGLQEHVVFAGRLDHSRIPDLLAEADIALAPFTPFFPGKGGSPMKLFEYMAAGKAIIASETGQVGEVLSDGETGLLVPPEDPSALAAALERLLNDEELRIEMGERAREVALSRHGWVHYAEELEGIYRRAIVSRRGKRLEANNES